MNKIQVVGSGSTGNSYIIDIDGDKLLVEAGVKWKTLLNNLYYDLNMMGMLISHSHH